MATEKTKKVAPVAATGLRILQNMPIFVILAL
jgi:hypothetical protein